MKLKRPQDIFRSQSSLGLSIQERSIRIAEVSTRDGVELVRAAELVFPAGASIEAPEALGAALKDFLKQRGFSTKHAVAGVPARWLLSREKEVPPLAAGLVGNALRLAAERDFSIESKDLVLDYAGEADAKEPRKVLIAAMMRQHLDRVAQLARAAGLRLDAITSSTLALAAAAAPDAPSGLFLVLAPGSLEVLMRDRGVPKLLKHIPVRSGSPDDAGGTGSTQGILAAAGEARRVIALSAGSGDAAALAGARLWDTLGVEPAVSLELAERAGLGAQALESPSLSGVASRLDPAQDSRPFAAAAALAVAGSRRQIRALDFLHSRCAPPERKIIGRRLLLVAATAAALVLGGVFLFIDLENRATELEKLKDSLAASGPNVQAAQGFSDKISYVMGWFDTRPPFLECLKQVTLAFPEEGKIWVTSLSAGESRKGLLSGRARDQKSILAVIDKLKASGKLSDVKLSDMRDAGGSSGEISFALSFSFTGLE